MFCVCVSVEKIIAYSNTFTLCVASINENSCQKVSLSVRVSLRYEILTPNAIPRTFMDGKQACELMVSDVTQTLIKEFMILIR